MKEITECMAIAIAVFIAVGWCGVLYPQLIMTEDIYQIVSEDGEVRGMKDITDYYELLQAEPEKLRIKSRLLERIV